jgi:phenylacetate-CoA ligase
VLYQEEIETMSRKKLEELQLKRLQDTVKRVYRNVPFYQKKLLEQGITPDDVQTLTDIKKLPFTKKTDLRANYPFGLLAVSMKEVIRIHSSSGTSGKPTTVAYTKNDINHWAEIMARCIAACGGEPGGILHNAYGYGLFTGGLGIHYGSEKLGMATVPVSAGNTERQVMLIEDYKPTVITATPSYLLNIIETMDKLGIDPQNTSLQYGILGAESWSQEIRTHIEERLNIKAMDIYGLSEVMGPGVGIECKEVQNGLHIAEDHFLVEIIDPESLDPVPDGEEGELVFTSLTKEAMPVIRYRTGDIASIIPDPCQCGRTHKRISRIKGRIDDMLIIRGVNVFPSEIESALLQFEELVPHYQLIISREGALDKVTLKVEINEKIYKSINQNLEHDKIKHLTARIYRKIKNSCLISVETLVESPGSIPRSEGKAIRVLKLNEKHVKI